MSSEVGRCVLDTNTLVSAYLFPDSKPGIALATVIERGTPLLSNETAEELASVLRREKFNRYLSRKRREELLVATLAESEMVEITSIVEVCRDPSDNKFLATAKDGNALCLVSGDTDLLILNPFQEIRILSPSEFLDYVKQE